VPVIEKASEPKWARTCRNPFVRHDWEFNGQVWIPNTHLDIDAFCNEECTECHLLCARCVGPEGNRFTLYNESTRPKDYRFALDECPSNLQFLTWYMTDAEQKMKSQGRRKSRGKRLQAVAS
jgi:hypothetical protein